ncbi:MAG: hypothetical protein JXR51_11225 [Bacteroidales bacterium]|nr:hypothetical protein [Bacteroidales bacterium]
MSDCINTHVSGYKIVYNLLSDSIIIIIIIESDKWYYGKIKASVLIIECKTIHHRFVGNAKSILPLICQYLKYVDIQVSEINNNM